MSTLSRTLIPSGVILTTLIFILCTYISWEKLGLVGRTIETGIRTIYAGDRPDPTDARPSVLRLKALRSGAGARACFLVLVPLQLVVPLPLPCVHPGLACQNASLRVPVTLIFGLFALILYFRESPDPPSQHCGCFCCYLSLDTCQPGAWGPGVALCYSGSDLVLGRCRSGSRK